MRGWGVRGHMLSVVSGSWMAGLVSSGRTLAAPENLHPNPALVWRGVKVCAREARRGP